jgi:hypothetical protein
MGSKMQAAGSLHRAHDDMAGQEWYESRCFAHARIRCRFRTAGSLADDQVPQHVIRWLGAVHNVMSTLPVFRVVKLDRAGIRDKR